MFKKFVFVLSILPFFVILSSCCKVDNPSPDPKLIASTKLNNASLSIACFNGKPLLVLQVESYTMGVVSDDAAIVDQNKNQVVCN